VRQKGAEANGGRDYLCHLGVFLAVFLEHELALGALVLVLSAAAVLASLSCWATGVRRVLFSTLFFFGRAFFFPHLCSSASFFLKSVSCPDPTGVFSSASFVVIKQKDK